MREALLTTGAILAFAGNSLLCRYALDSGRIDPASFTLVRLVSGTLSLYLMCCVTRRKLATPDPVSAAALLVYALAFAYAYVAIGAAAGALVLFATVQITMLSSAVIGGARPAPAVWTGILLACVGVGALVAPRVSSPPLKESLLMAAAGFAWGVYSLRGRSGGEPVAATLGNFVGAAGAMVILRIADPSADVLSTEGLTLGIASGALTSGLGYAIWYAVLPDLGAVRAASAQLLVPALTAVGGVLLLHEPLTLRIVTSAALIIGGVALAQRQSALRSPRNE